MRRRDFLALATAAVVGAPRLDADNSVVSQNPLVAQYNVESLLDRYTPLDDFYVRDHFAVPADLTRATLQIDGEVQAPQTLTADDLARLPAKRLAAVLECAGNGTGPYQLASNAEWEGWALDDVLRLARPRESAQYLHLQGRDGFIRSVPLTRVRQDAMLATRINQQSLPAGHGAPWRALFPGYYGMDSVKWLARITVANSPLEPASNDYLAMQKAPDGAVQRLPLPLIQLKSVFVYPAVGAVLQMGRVKARGVAWSNGEEIMAAEVSADGGKTWRLASLDPPDGRYGWRLWHASLDLHERGLVELACKAIDSQGREQPADRPDDRIDGYADNRIQRIRVMVI
jgi:DMSO/TMAO reductase YedYZ molybdopterin-dependent catalytic subunit